MTKLLQQAVAEVAKLPDEEQEAIAALLLDELASDRRWSEVLAKSQDQLAGLADEALAEFAGGQTRPLENDSDLTHD